MQKITLFVLAGLLMGFGVGFSVSDILNKENEHNHDHSSKVNHDQMRAKHSHSSYEVKGELVPSIDMSVTEDSKSGWNIVLNTSNFKFTPENVGKENVEGEGHAHLYVDGEKVARLYGNFYHYDGKFEGTKKFKVTLNSNDHSEYSKDGKIIEAIVDVTHKHD